MRPGAAVSSRRPDCATARSARTTRLTLVSAPAGFGKTTLLTEWFADGPRDGVALARRRDNDPTLFWSYVIAALRTVVPGVGEEAPSVLARRSRRRCGRGGVLNDLDAPPPTSCGARRLPRDRVDGDCTSR